MTASSIKAATAMGFLFSIGSFACAQNVELSNAPHFAFMATSEANAEARAFDPNSFRLTLSSSGDRSMWHNVLVISAIVGIVGIATQDSTLTILGAAGVVLSLVETGGSTFRFRSATHGMDLMESGPFTFGINPFSQLDGSSISTKPSAAPYMRLSFKF